LEEAGLRKSLGLEARKTIIERGSFEGLWLQIQGKLAGL
jgi:hypothetical protein